MNNLREYKIDDGYKFDGVDYIHCLVRKKMIKLTPEELVRQRFLSYLFVNQKLIDTTVDVEVHLSIFNSKIKDRADVIIYAEKEQASPLLLIEFKALTVPLTDDVLKQAKRYNEFVKSRFIGVSNGEDNMFFELVNTDYIEISFENITELFDSIYVKVDELAEKWIRITEKELKDDLFFEDYCNTAVCDTPTRFKRYYFSQHSITIIKKAASKLLDLFMVVEENELLKLNCKTATLVKDKGLRFGKYGAFGGYTFTEYYRYFILEDKAGNHFTVNFTIFSFFKNDTEKGVDIPSSYKGTYLIVGLDTKEHSNHVLELKLDKYCEISNEKFSIVHDGTLVAKTKRKNSLTIEFIKKKQPGLIINSKVHLGNLPLNKELTFKDSSVINFISNLIDYVYWREVLKDELRK